MSRSRPGDSSGGPPPPSEALAALARLMHELRTPLMAMGMTAELLSEDLDHLEQPQVRQLVDTLHRNSVWLHELVENLHEFTALRRGPGVQVGTPVDLGAVLHETGHIIGPVLTAKGQCLDVRAPAPLPLVRGVPQQLGQMYLNLLANASKFAPPDTVIRVTLTRTPAAVRVAVEDRGPGIPAGAVARVFEPFYQAATPTAPGQRGVGLGLAIVKEIVEAHGGRVGAENRRGGGARVWCELPQDREPALRLQ